MYDNDDYDLGTDLGDVNEHEFDCIPAGKYPTQCVSIELTDTKAGGKMVKATFEVVGGEFSNRKIFENYNVQHAKESVVNISLGHIKKWLVACGLEPNQRLTLNLLRQLEGREFLALVKVEKDKNGVFSDQNRINKYEAISGATFQAPASAPYHPAFIPPSQSMAGPASQSGPVQTAYTPPIAQAKPAPAVGGQMPWQK